MKTFLKRTVLGLSLALVASLTVLPQWAEAKRLGGGKSTGTQSSNVTQKQAPAATPAAPAAAAAPGAAAAAAAPARNKWLGPLAGLAAGLGIAALLSSMGLGGAMAEMIGSMLLIGGLVLVALLAWRWWRNRSAGNAGGAAGQPAFAGAGAGTGYTGAQPTAQPTAFTPKDNVTAFTPATPAAFGASPGGVAAGLAGGAMAGAVTGATAAGGATWAIPAGFDTDDFIHISKMYFVRLQAAWDARNEGDIRTFTTPEMFAEIKLDLVARGEAHNQTDVVTLDAQLLGVEERGEKTLASVRLSGMLREAVGAPAEPFAEVWNLEKPAAARASWVLAGIQQES